MPPSRRPRLAAPEPVAAVASVDPGVQAAQGPLASRLTRGVGIAGAGFVLTRGITFATYIVLAQLIAPSDAGQLAAAQVVLGVGFVFAESGMLAALIHWPEDIDAAASTAVASTVASGVGLSVLGLATAPVVGLYFDSSTIGWVAAASAGLLLLRSLQIVPDALLQRNFAFVRRVTIDPLGAVAQAVVAIGASAAGLGVWGLLAGQYALYGSQMLAGWLLLKWRPRRHLMTVATWRRLAGYARHVVVSEVVRRTSAELDSILLGRFAGAGPLGQYAYGRRIAAVPTDGWVTVASFALLPAFARIADDAARFRRAFVEAFTVMATIGLPLSLVLLVAGNPLALALFGTEWAQSGSAITALCAVGIGQMLNSICSEAYKARGRPQLLTRLHLFTTVLSAALIPTGLLVFRDDVVGVSVAVSAIQLASGVYALRLVVPVVGVRILALLASVGGIVCATAIGVAASFAVRWWALGDADGRGGAAVQALASSAVLLVTYAVAVRVLAPAPVARLVAAARDARSRG